MKGVIYVLMLCVSFFCSTYIFDQTDADAQEGALEQPSMEKAIDHLKKAKALLALAASDKKPDRDTVTQIRKSKTVLEGVQQNKGGHRVEAIRILNIAAKADTNAAAGRLIDDAIDEIQKGMKFAEAEAAKPLFQKHMMAARDHLAKAKAALSADRTGRTPGKEAVAELQKARTSLDQAAGGKGGHREKAIGLINQAVRASSVDAAIKLTDMATDEVNMGIDYAEKHRKK